MPNIAVRVLNKFGPWSLGSLLIVLFDKTSILVPNPEFLPWPSIPAPGPEFLPWLHASSWPWVQTSAPGVPSLFPRWILATPLWVLKYLKIRRQGTTQINDPDQCVSWNVGVYQTSSQNPLPLSSWHVSSRRSVQDSPPFLSPRILILYVDDNHWYFPGELNLMTLIFSAYGSWCNFTGSLGSVARGATTMIFVCNTLRRDDSQVFFIKVTHLAFKPPTNEEFKEMNGPFTSCRELKPRIRMQSSLRPIGGSFGRVKVIMRSIKFGFLQGIISKWSFQGTSDASLSEAFKAYR